MPVAVFLFFLALPSSHPFTYLLLPSFLFAQPSQEATVVGADFIRLHLHMTVVDEDAKAEKEFEVRKGARKKGRTAPLFFSFNPSPLDPNAAYTNPSLSINRYCSKDGKAPGP